MFILIILLGASLFINFKTYKRNKIFSNNIKCAEYTEKQNIEINKISQLPVNQNKIITSPKIFFSSKLNTCVSAFSVRDFNKEGFNSFYIINLLNSQSILAEGGELKETVDGVSIADIAEQKYRQKLKEIGGE